MRKALITIHSSSELSLFYEIMLRFSFLGFIVLAANAGQTCAVGDHKRILYEKTVGRYAVESKEKVQTKYIKTGGCVRRETEMDGSIELCLNLNSTYSKSHDDAWIVKSEDGRIIELTI